MADCKHENLALYRTDRSVTKHYVIRREAGLVVCENDGQTHDFETVDEHFSCDDCGNQVEVEDNDSDLEIEFE